MTSYDVSFSAFYSHHKSLVYFVSKYCDIRCCRNKCQGVNLLWIMVFIMIFKIFTAVSSARSWGSRSADQLSKFRLDSQGIDHSVKGKNEKWYFQGIITRKIWLSRNKYQFPVSFVKVSRNLILIFKEFCAESWSLEFQALTEALWIQVLLFWPNTRPNIWIVLNLDL